eukprot:CAMPEP_0183406770 /NCGR_PEP_ID=MMETSP0370-20130417/16857_1 /TAXON_ID=268820 /ORGANISM="Peridinium aciculiferum, Strain PAER-2" /LENGTH=59 /DNA_ID=CAMNT_0025589011 /DNA_START=234 /DNA_END=410 /DNA_ORIENTATION=-
MAMGPSTGGGGGSSGKVSGRFAADVAGSLLCAPFAVCSETGWSVSANLCVAACVATSEL